jgi:hypothetical protein
LISASIVLIVWAISTFFIAPKPPGYAGVDVSALMASPSRKASVVQR